MADRDWFHYEVGVDVGWGCLWRSYQNALLVALGDRAAVPTLQEMMDALTEPAARHRVMEVPPLRWAEPAILPKLCLDLPVEFECRCFLSPANRDLFQKTDPDDYVPMSARDAAVIFQRLSEDSRAAAVFDDGITGSCFFVQDNHLVEVDPHCTTRGVVSSWNPTIARSTFVEKCLAGAMIAVVTPSRDVTPSHDATSSNDA